MDHTVNTTTVGTCAAGQILRLPTFRLLRS